MSRKISSAVARIKLGLQDDVALGNLEAQRDWGFSGDYVRAMWLMLQQDTPDDYVVATGESHSIRDFLDLAFAEAGIEDWTNYVKQDPRFMRPAEVDVVVGDYSKANRELGWEPTVKFPQLVRMMVQHDLEARGSRNVYVALVEDFRTAGYQRSQRTTSSMGFQPRLAEPGAVSGPCLPTARTATGCTSAGIPSNPRRPSQPSPACRTRHRQAPRQGRRARSASPQRRRPPTSRARAMRTPRPRPRASCRARDNARDSPPHGHKR